MLIGCGVAAMWISAKVVPAPMTREQAMGMIVFPVQFIAAVLSPVLALLFMPRAKQRMWFYLLFQLLMGLIYLICSIAADMPTGESPSTYLWLSPFPTSSLFALMQKSSNLTVVEGFLHLAVPVSCAMLLYLLYRVLREFKQLRRYEEAALVEAKKQNAAA